MRWILVFALMLMCMTCARADGPYYLSNCDAGTISTVDAACVNGNDANDGLSTGAPKRTFSALQTLVNNAPATGRTIRLAYGAKWVTSSPLSLTSCTGGASHCSATNPLVIEGYAPSFGSGTQWIIEMTPDLNILKFEDSGTSEQDQGYVVRGGRIHGNGTATNVQPCIQLYNDVDDVLIDTMEIDHCGIGLNVVGGGNGVTGGDPGNGYQERITVRSSHIHDHGLQGYLGGCPYCVLENSNIHDNGWGGDRNATSLQFNHNVYISCGVPGGMCNGMRVVGNSLYNSARCEARTPPNGAITCTSQGILNKCAGSTIVVHAQFQNLVIENNVTDETGGAAAGCFGIDLGPNYANQNEWFRDSIVRGNKIINVGSVGIGIGSCPYCIVEGNEIIKSVNDGSSMVGIAMPDGTVETGPTYFDDADTNILIRNNTIYLQGTNTANYGIQIKTPGSGLNQRIVSNLVVFGPAAVSGVSCYNNTNSISNFAAWDYNQCYSAGAAANLNTSTNTSMASWQGAGYDAHGTYGIDPLLATPSSPAYSVAPNSSSSPLRNTGHPTLSKSLGIRGQKDPDTTHVGANPYNSTVVAPNAPSSRE